MKLDIRHTLWKQTKKRLTRNTIKRKRNGFDAIFAPNLPIRCLSTPRSFTFEAFHVFLFKYKKRSFPIKHKFIKVVKWQLSLQLEFIAKLHYLLTCLNKQQSLNCVLNTKKALVNRNPIMSKNEFPQR